MISHNHSTCAVLAVLAALVAPTVEGAQKKPAKAQAKAEQGQFEYDPADEIVHAALVGGEDCYDLQVVAVGDVLWGTWLQFEAEKGDRIWIGRRKLDGADWISRTCITSEPGMYKNPALTADETGGFWLTFEQGQDEKWSVRAIRLEGDGQIRARRALVYRSPKGEAASGDSSGGGHPARLDPAVKEDESSSALRIGSGINHRIAAAPNGGAWVVWQTPKDGQFDIAMARLTDDGVCNATTLGYTPDASDWQPAVAVGSHGEVRIVWDAQHTRCSSFDIHTCVWRNDAWDWQTLGSPDDRFEARARAAADSSGRVWVAWEEGSANWGERYVPRMHKNDPAQMDISDANGPLHAFRKLRVGLLTGDGSLVIPPALPMPAFEKLKHRGEVPAGVADLGGYYEHPELTVDGTGRLWVVYRHYYLPWLGVQNIHHVQQAWGVYARCFDGKNWSKLFKCDIGQGDGMQRLEVAPLADGIVLSYTTGRTDRRPNSTPAGVALATIRLEGKAVEPKAAKPGKLQPSAVCMVDPGHESHDYRPYFGDLHRHTDLSLCRVPTDGTIEDAYRYAIDVAHLDFMGITDHSRDIAEGSAKSLLWWRCVKEVSRHDLSPRFVPMYAYEHSRAGEDHNVVSLKPRLWPDSMPFPELWKLMDGDVFSIPHQTVCPAIPASGEMPFGIDEKTWTYGDNEHRRLIEVYQGGRDRVIENDANRGLSKGHILGFIASSDHLSTNASFAGTWAKEASREAIFRAMQARRTFGAMARISIKMTMGDHWMGEVVPAAELGPVHVEATGTAKIESIELIVDGRVQQKLPQDQQQVAVDITLPTFAGGGIHYFYVRLKQVDGNMAWASPIWVK